ncbi:MAG: DUF2254 domain-containing protein [Micrococcales bacterium]|nr:DUF2254 domain-containing protein [Micrococcales bacterium]
MKTWLANVREAFETKLWPLPTIAVVAALLLGLGLPKLDAQVNRYLSVQMSGWLFDGDADAARSLLGAISSSLITVTSLTFSLTVVTLQLASSQFSPRLLRTFTRDQFVQATLALFLATFTFSLTVLRSVRSAGDSDQSEFVPKFAVTLAFVMAVASVLGLVLFLAHLAEQIRVETMLRDVRRDATNTIRAVLRTRNAADDRPHEPPAPPLSAVRLLAGDDGFLTWIDQGNLLEVAADEDALVRIDVYPGSFLVRGTPLGVTWPAQDAVFDEEAAQRVAERISACIHTGFERTASQDAGYGLRQLTDVANKALSPGVNDPTTAIHALGHIGAVLCDLSDRDLHAELLEDQDGQVRVTLRRPDFAAYVEEGISQPRRYGATDPQVMAKIFQVLLDLGHRVAPEQRGVILGQLERLRATVAAQSFDDHEQATLAELGRRVEDTLRHTGPRSAPPVT